MLVLAKINESKINFLRGAICISFVMILGFLSGISTSSEIQTWYVNIIKPSFNPPNYLFGPVWSLLYILMGISLTLIIKQKPSVERTKALVIFFFQFALNLGWSVIFFKMHEIGWAFIEILVMWVSIVVMIIFLYRVKKIAGLIQIPYLLWVSFASLLNGSIYYLN